jgi:GntR family transcriptional repressor for pyruvate dehydrogenase complex
MFQTLGFEDGLLSVRVAQQIRELVRSGELERGDRLPAERDLSERLAVSRTVVREAIKMLRVSGLVKVRLGVGTFIADDPVNILEGNLIYTVDQEAKKIADLQQIRDVLEPAIAALAAQNATHEDIRKIENAIQVMDDNFDDKYKYIEADNLFHLVLADATQNSVFSVLLNSIVDLLHEARRLAISSPGAGERSEIYHHRILDAIKAKDPDEALNAMSEHMHQAKLDIQASILKKSVGPK